VGKVFQGIHDHARLVQTCATSLAILDVSSEWSNPKAHFLVEEQVDLVWK